MLEFRKNIAKQLYLSTSQKLQLCFFLLIPTSRWIYKYIYHNFTHTCICIVYMYIRLYITDVIKTYFSLGVLCVKHSEDDISLDWVFCKVEEMKRSMWNMYALLYFHRAIIRTVNFTTLTSFLFPTIRFSLSSYHKLTFYCTVGWERIVDKDTIVCAILCSNLNQLLYFAIIIYILYFHKIKK